MSEAYHQFAKWLQEQPKWLQDAAWRIYHNQPTNAQHFDLYADMCIAEINSEIVKHQRIEFDAILPSAQKQQLEILGIKDINGVNALDKEATIDFNPSGISVVYGLNGAGKSGYMRIIKCACGTPYAEAICSNAFKKEKEEPSCVFEIQFEKHKVNIPVKLNDEHKPKELSHCDVFDSMISSVYITKQTSVSYEPFVFTVLTELAKLAERIKSVLEKRKESLAKASICLPESYIHLDIALWQIELSPETIIPENFYIWGDVYKERLTEIKALLDTEAVEKKIATLKIERNKLEDILNELSDKMNYICANTKMLKEELESLKSAKAQSDIAANLFSQNADDIDKKSISNKDWKTLWQTARKYYDELLFPVHSDIFGDIGSVCPLCHQQISRNFQTRFSSIDGYINGVTAENYAKAKNIFESHLSKILDSSSAKTIERIIDGIVDKELQERIVNLFKQIDVIRAAARDKTALKKILELDIKSVIQAISETQGNKQQELNELANALDVEGKSKLLLEMNELSYRNWVFEHLEDIQIEINRLKAEQIIDSACGLLTTNKITIEANRLAQALITEAYINRFSDELKLLAPKLRVRIEKSPSQKGKSPYKVILDAEDPSLKNKPELVLSEGEQRIVAIAAFFADATGRSELTPIVIDDPISSLDYNYEGRTTERIVQMAKTRQVIVFTHRISFLVGIKEACDKYNVDFCERHIRSISDKKGVRGLDTEYTGNIKQQLSGLIGILGKLNASDEGTPLFEATKGMVCQQFRICIERAVEDVLLNRIVKRFDRIIHTKGKLEKLVLIDKADCEIIDSMMTKYSFPEHSQPDDACSSDIPVAEIGQDIETFRKWIDLYNKKLQ